MFKDVLLGALRRTHKTDKPDNEMLQVIGKIQEQKRLSSKEFLKVHDAIWKDGPKIRYQCPDSWSRPLES